MKITQLKQIIKEVINKSEKNLPNNINTLNKLLANVPKLKNEDEYYDYILPIQQKLHQLISKKYKNVKYVETQSKYYNYPSSYVIFSIPIDSSNGLIRTLNNNNISDVKKDFNYFYKQDKMQYYEIYDEYDTKLLLKYLKLKLEYSHAILKFYGVGKKTSKEISNDYHIENNTFLNKGKADIYYYIVDNDNNTLHKDGKIRTKNLKDIVTYAFRNINNSKAFLKKWLSSNKTYKMSKSEMKYSW